MDSMFSVRSARALTPTALSRALPVHMPLASPLHLAPSRLPGRTASRHRTPAFRLGSTRTRSTSRSASTRPRSRTWASCSPCAPRVPWPQRPHAFRAAPLPTSHACLSTRQNAQAFNQPLSFDTAKVTNMFAMFSVRSARALPPPSLESGHPRACRACRLRRRHPKPSRLPGCTSSHIACPPFDSAASVGVQPAAQLRHVQRHSHGLHVLRALCACPAPPSLESVPPCACRLHRRRPTPSHRASHVPSFRLGRTQTPCPTPTSCSSVARGRAPRPSPPLAMARAGVREAVRHRPRRRCRRRCRPLPSRTRPP